MATDLHSTVVAELDRLERLYGGDRKDGRHAALSVAVGLHSDYKGDCGGCDMPMPCPTVRLIAQALGVVRDGG